MNDPSTRCINNELTPDANDETPPTRRLGSSDESTQRASIELTRVPPDDPPHDRRLESKSERQVGSTHAHRLDSMHEHRIESIRPMDGTRVVSNDLMRPRVAGWIVDSAHDLIGLPR